MGAIYFRDSSGNVHKVSAADPLPVSDSGSVQASDMNATAPVTWDAGTSTIGITTDTAGGVPVLDASGLVKLAQMPISGLNYHGHWDASTNTPTLADGTGAAGDMYRVHVAGSQDLGSGSITFDVGDLVVYEGAVWQKFAAATGVISVNGQTGAVSLAAADVSALPTAGGTMTGAIHMGDNKVINVGVPTNARDAATKAYVDDAASGTAAWGSITGTLADQTDLKTALDGKLGLGGGTLNGDLHSSAAIESTTAMRAVALVGTSYIASQGNVTATDEIHSDTGLTLKSTTTPPTATASVASIYAEAVDTEQQLVAQWPDGTSYVLARQGAPEAAAGRLSVATHTEADAPSIAADDPQVQLYDLSAASVSQDINLPADAATGTVFTIKKIDASANKLLFFAQGGQLIDGQDSASISAQHASRTIVFDGSNWRIIGAWGS